ncbi:MAG: hypothetical protein MI922_28930 [Bacteroidales bacterium]|nr:hypothetical protein [Bacteroidales bacterium]
MKELKLIAIVFLLSMFGIANAQYYGAPKPKFDTIIKIEGKQLIVDVTTVTQNYISFKDPKTEEVYRLNRKEIHKIIYKNGRIEDYNPKVVMMIAEDDYKAVWLTNDKQEVAELYSRGKVEAHGTSKRGVNAAKKNATIKIQKNAAVKKAQVIFVTKRQVTGGYGELPGYLIEGIAYGTEPLDENGELQTN